MRYDVARMSNRSNDIKAFNLPRGHIVAGKYEVRSLLGAGWEGEVYRVVERRTGIHRAMKLFFPQRNVRDKAVRFYAKKLDRLRHCRIVIQYHHSETIRHGQHVISCLMSEFVEGTLLSRMIERHPQHRLEVFEALHLLHALAAGLEEIHAAHEYHGDIHSGNVLVRRNGIRYDVKLVDFYHWGRTSRYNIREDVIQLVHLFHESLGGRATYAAHPPEVKAICRGLRRDLLKKRFPTARYLREHLETCEWRTR